MTISIKSQHLVQVTMPEQDLIFQRRLIIGMLNILMSIGGMLLMHILLLRSGKAEAGIYLPKMLQVLTPGSTIGQQDKL